MPLSMHRFSVAVRSRAPWRQRLLVAAVRHSNLVQHRFTQQLWKRLSGHVHHQLLFNRYSAARIPFLRARQNVYANRRGVCRLLPIENLDQRRHWRIHVVPRESMHRQPARVRHQAPQRHLLFLRELVLRHLPRLQLHVHVFIQRQLPVLHQIQGSGRCHGLADGPCLKERLWGHRCGRSRPNRSVSFGPDNLEVIDHRDA